jgi:hypothetical protein
MVPPELLGKPTQPAFGQKSVILRESLPTALLEFVGGQIHRSVLCQREYAPDQDASQMPIQRCLTALMLANERKHLMDKAKT